MLSILNKYVPEKRCFSAKLKMKTSMSYITMSNYKYYPSYYKQQDNSSSYPFFSLLFLSLYTYYRCNKLEKEIEEIKNKKV